MPLHQAFYSYLQTLYMYHPLKNTENWESNRFKTLHKFIFLFVHSTLLSHNSNTVIINYIKTKTAVASEGLPKQKVNLPPLFTAALKEGK